MPCRAGYTAPGPVLVDVLDRTVLPCHGLPLGLGRAVTPAPPGLVAGPQPEDTAVVLVAVLIVECFNILIWSSGLVKEGANKKIS